MSVDPDLQVEPEQLAPWRVALLALSRVWIALFLLVIVGYFSVATPGHAFFQADNFKTIALDTSEVILLAVGQTFVIVTAGIDLSVGGILVFSGVAGGLTMLNQSGTKAQTDALMYPHAGWAVPLGIVVCLLAGIGWGIFNGVIIAKLKMPPFIVTLGTLGITFGAADLLSGGTNLSSVPTGFQNHIGNGKLLGIYVPVLIAAIVALIAWITMRFTRFGRYTQAVGSNEEAARRAGIKTDRPLLAGGPGRRDDHRRRLHRSDPPPPPMSRLRTSRGVRSAWIALRSGVRALRALPPALRRPRARSHQTHGTTHATFETGSLSRSSSCWRGGPRHI
jgi:ribose/xylose/arabinose/galactoside ABC-type transport system permease subunit